MFYLVLPCGSKDINIKYPIQTKLSYRISANSFRGNYSFLNVALFTVTFDLYFINLNSCSGNYSREETIQGRKLFAEIRYLLFQRSPTQMEILSIVFKNVWFPLHYVADIVKDSIQLILCLIVVGGLENALNNWLSFSSVVIAVTGLITIN